MNIAALFPQSDRTECVEVYLYDMDTVPSLGESQVFVPLWGGAEGMSLQVIGFDPPDIVTHQQGGFNLLYASLFRCHVL